MINESHIGLLIHIAVEELKWLNPDNRELAQTPEDFAYEVFAIDSSIHIEEAKILVKKLVRDEVIKKSNTTRLIEKTDYAGKKVFEQKYIEDKKCSRCNEVKPKEMFHKDRRTTNGLKSWCKECASEYKKKKYNENVKSERKKQREAYHARVSTDEGRKIERLKWRANYQKPHEKERIKSYQKSHFKKMYYHPDREIREAYREKRRQKKREWRKRHG